MEVVGLGPAGLAATVALGKMGHEVALSGVASSYDRWVTLNTATCELLRSVFGDDVFEEPPAIQGRIRVLRWRRQEGVERVEDASIIVRMSALTAAMAKRAKGKATSGISSAGRLLAIGRSAQQPIAKAPARMTSVWDDIGPMGARLLDEMRAQSFIGAYETGWLFMAKTPNGSAFAQACYLPSPDGRSLAAQLLRNVLGDAAYALADPLEFDTTPSLGKCFAPDGAVLAGDAVLALDPLSGDGVGTAIRTSLAAAAVLARSVTHKNESDALRHHLRYRLLKAYIGHLERCVGLYRVSRCARVWVDCIAMMDLESRRLKMVAEANPHPNYVLTECGLVPSGRPSRAPHFEPSTTGLGGEAKNGEADRTGTGDHSTKS